MGDFGIKISQPGYDVKTATDQQLVYSSKYSVLKAKLQGLQYVSGSVTIPHNLGYAPAFVVFGLASGYSFKLPRQYTGSDPVGGGMIGYAYTDATNLYATIANGNWIYYYIFVDPVYQ